MSRSFTEGPVFHGDLVKGIDIGGAFHVIGTGHTAISGVYDGNNGTLVLENCNRQA